MTNKKTKQPDASAHIRIDIGLSNEIDILRAGFDVRVSRCAFVEGLIRRGIVDYKKQNASRCADGWEATAAELIDKEAD